MGVRKLWDQVTKAFLYFPEEGASPERYRTLRRNMITLMLLVTILPLAIMAIINYHQYQRSIKDEIINPLLFMANRTRHSVELFLEERLATVRLLAFDHDFEELADQRKLNHIFSVLKQEVGGFVDLGLIDQNGRQLSYAGPYALLGKDYSEQFWFHEVVLRGSYISDVFMGYRKFPHVAIAVQRPTEEGRFLILRATIDTKKFEDLITAIGLDEQSDAFLINHDGIFQTNSKFYGKVLEQCPIPMPPGRYGTNVAEQVDPEGRDVIIAYTHFGQPDYTLVIVKPRSVLLKSWYTLKSEMFFIFVVGAAVIILVIFKLTEVMVKRIRQADERREEAFRELEHSHKLSSIGRLAAGVAHEINNPMAIIKEKAGLMKDLMELDPNFPEKDKFSRQVSSILQSVDRCRAVTHRLLGFARRMEVQTEMLDLNEVIKDVLSFLEREALFRNIQIELQLSEDLPRIPSDRGQLQQIFLNVLTNAMMAVDDGGQVTITSRDHDLETVAVAIKDNGHGMSQDTLEHLFEPFFTTKRGYGTGLGLSITYGLVKKLGGDIKAESQEGKGATFTVYLPKRSAEASGA
jgi:two-component system NtrC family sensor kinase